MILEFYLAASLPLFFLLVFLEGGQRRVLAYPDAELTRLGINEGDAVRLEHHTLTKC